MDTLVLKILKIYLPDVHQSKIRNEPICNLNIRGRTKINLDDHVVRRTSGKAAIRWNI
jgi:hypothetical protein